jgi:hypothetical protein
MYGPSESGRLSVWRNLVSITGEGAVARGELEQIQLLGHASVQTTERYLGTGRI